MYNRELKSIYEKLNQHELLAFYGVVKDMEFEAKYNYKKWLLVWLFFSTLLFWLVLTIYYFVA